MMRKELVGESDLNRMFLEEARISSRLTHPNIVNVYEVIEHDGVPTLVMEYLEGQPLWTVVRNAAVRFPLRLHLHVLAKVLAGLNAAHELGDYDGTALNLIHRDVSPHNVFLLYDGQVKVLDFGIAKAGSEVRRAPAAWESPACRRAAHSREAGPPRGRVRRGVPTWEALGSGATGVTGGGRRHPRSARQAPPPCPATSHRAARRDLPARAGAEPRRSFATAGEFQRELESCLFARARGGPDDLGRPCAALATERDAAKRASKHLVGACPMTATRDGRAWSRRQPPPSPPPSRA
jgi:serine/threonine-protein kinase